MDAMAKIALAVFCLFAFGGGQAWAAASQPFEQWVAAFHQKALQEGISQQTAGSALSDVGFLPRVLELDKKQPEKAMGFSGYVRQVVNKERVRRGRELMHSHAGVLSEVERRYGVPPQYVVALWGIETSYGRNTGGFNVINSLATLAWDGRRRDFFANELLDALRIIDQGHVRSASEMSGSWAGAMGQNQFMPSSFHRFAVDGNGDGRKDIWSSLPDVFASTANYLARSGWKPDERWGREVKIPKSLPSSLIGLETAKPLSEWNSLGVTLPGGGALPVADMKASLVAPDGSGGRAFLVYDNYKTIMKWNRSTYFATSVGLLADAIAR